MTIVKRPSRLFSFTDWTKSHPREQPPGDRLDAMFIELVEAIQSTQDALAEIRQPNGTLKPRSIGPEHLRANLVEEVTDAIGHAVEPVRAVILHATDNVRDHEQNAALYAKDAEAAVSVAQKLTAGMAALRRNIEARADFNSKSKDAADSFATDSENWANYSKAQSDNAIAAKDEALQWAEFLAGPVVNARDAPAYIAGTPFPNGLYYQPVQGGLAGLWSAKWWALHAQQLVGTAGFYYLGPWDHPPLPGEQNPSTGQVVPTPLAPGSLYYDTVAQTLYVWSGTAWSTPMAVGQGYLARFVYVATAGQQNFSGADSNAATPVVGAAASDVYVNGVRLVPVSDYTVDNVTNTLHILSPLTVNSIVQWDLLLSPGQLAPGAMTSFKCLPLMPDGVTQSFHLQYSNPVGGAATDTTVGDGAQLLVSLDGVIQEVGKDYTASGHTLSMAAPPLIDADLWVGLVQAGGMT